jgi:hypothetical protein
MSLRCGTTCRTQSGKLYQRSRSSPTLQWARCCSSSGSELGVRVEAGTGTGNPSNSLLRPPSKSSLLLNCLDSRIADR